MLFCNMDTEPLTTIDCYENWENPLKLEDSAVFHSSNEEARLRLLKCFRHINRAFPFYIPIQHHTISLVEYLNDLDDDETVFWGVAAHYLLSNKAYGFPMWKSLQEQMQIERNSSREDCKPFISIGLKNFILENGLEHTNNDVDEFLLEPWVLIQLPFQPVVLHQWLVATFYKILKFELELSPLLNISVPIKFLSLVDSLQDLLYFTQQKMGFLFDALQKQTKKDVSISFPIKNNIFKRNLDVICNFLEFCINKDGQKVVRSLRKVCWEKWKHDIKLDRVSKKNMLLCKRRFIYNLAFWRHPGVKIFGQSSDDTVDTLLESTSGNENLDIDVQNFKETFSSIFEKSRSTLNRIDMNELKENSDFRKLIQTLNAHIKLTNSMRIQESDYGVLGQILYYTASVRVWDSCNQIIQFLSRKFRISPIKFFDHSKEEYFDLEEIKAKLKCISRIFDINEKTKLETLLDAEMKKIGQPNKKCPNVSEKLEKIATKFEVRIKKIVLDTIKPYFYNKDPGIQRGVTWRDCHFVQYLLPCFVVSFLNVCQSVEGRQNKRLKAWFIKFLHHIILQYEQKGVTWSQKKLSIQDGNHLLNPLNHDYVEDYNMKLLNYCKSVGDAFLHEVKQLAGSNIFGPFYEFLEKSNNSSLATPSKYWNWLMLDFFQRMQHSLYYASTDKSIIVSSDPRRKIMYIIRKICASDDYCFFNSGKKHYSILTFLYYLKTDVSEKCLAALKRTYKRKATSLGAEIGKELNKMTEQQALCLAFYLAMRIVDKPAQEAVHTLEEDPTPGEKAYHNYLTDPKLDELKRFYFSYFDSYKDEQRRVSYKFAKQEAPACYILALSECSEKERGLRDWYFPIKTCLTCGFADILEKPLKRSVPNCFCSNYCTENFKTNPQKVYY